MALAVVGTVCAAKPSETHKGHLDMLYPNTYELCQVKLLDGPFLHAQEKNIEVLKSYDVDRLLAPYLLEAGLEPKARPFENWAGLDGHVGGHYLSALAIHYADTGDPELLRIMNYMLDEMARVQEANGDGYVGGVPGSRQCWADLRAGDVSAISSRWVPWYNMHKVYAGLRDAYTYAGIDRAKDMFLALCDWGVEVIGHLDDQQMERMLDTEFGGMNEVYADAYDLTGDERYLDAAIRFSHRWLLDSMAAGKDNLDNRHANTQVPKAVGYQRVAEMCAKAGRAEQAKLFTDAASYFWHTVADTRSLALGGNSRREYFPSASDCYSYVEDREGPESCNTNNMLKLTEGLFRMNNASNLADFYERAMFNHILSTQHPEHGGYVYFTSARPGHYRVYSSPNAAMWCCVGTGMENHGKYGQFVYTHSGDTLAVNLFVASELETDKMRLTQATGFPDQESSRITVEPKKKGVYTLKVRKPSWCDGFALKVNGEDVAAEPMADGYVPLSRKWKKGDVIDIALPMDVRLEELPNVPDYVAIMRGPILLAARSGNQDLKGLVADDGRWAHIASGSLVPVTDAPALIGDREDILAKLKNMQPVGDGPMRYKVPGLFEGEHADIVLEPFARIHDSRYVMYWLTMTPQQWQARQEEIAAKEAERLRLDARTVDAVNFGEQQPEVDHRLKSANSVTGNYQGESYRHAENGWFSIELATKGRTDLSLITRYWGNESGNRTFDILVDDTVLATCDNAKLLGKSEFVDKTYTVPSELLEGKEYVKVSFKAHDGHIAGGVYHVRLVHE